MLSKAEIEMLGLSAPDELMAYIRALTPKAREARHLMLRATRDFQHVSCLVATAKAVLLAKRTEMDARAKIEKKAKRAR